MERYKSRKREEEIVWSSELAYATGLMASDGCLSTNLRHLLFVSKDYEQVENLRKCLGITAKIDRHYSGRENDPNEYYQMQWSDVSRYDFFLKIGLTPKKSLTLGALEIPDEYFFDFLRGSFDGDGSFYSYFDPRWKNSFMFYTVFISASKIHIEWLQKSLQRLLGISGHITHTGSGGGVYNLRFAKKESLVLLPHLYQNKDAPHLLRKKLKIENALRIVGESIHRN